MPKEIETRVINVDKNEVLARLREVGAKYIATRNFKRIEFLVKGKVSNVYKGSKTWARLRTDGKTTTFTLKERKGSALTHTKEWETEVADFKTAATILCKMIKPTFYEENLRIEYSYNGTKITLDKWPEIQWLVEIEGESAKKVNWVYKELAIKGKPVGNMSIVEVYRLYGIDLIQLTRKNNEKLRRLIGA